MDCVSEEVVEKEIVETWVLVKRSFDVAEESWKDILRKCLGMHVYLLLMIQPPLHMRAMPP